MKAKLTIYFYVALLTTIIYGAKSLLDCSNDVTKIAKQGGLIEDIFQPIGETHLGTIGGFSFTFRGILLPSKKEIAMKFTLLEKEYVMYKYLDAIDNEDVEQYGIPSVYYYGKWNKNNLPMIGILLLDQSVNDLKKSKQLFENDANVLIILRDFILSSKYMHSRGVRHNDIKLANMMVRGHQTFIIDFNLSSKIHEMTTGGTLNFAPKRAYMPWEWWPKDDWESFLYSICYSLGARFEWMNLDRSQKERISALKKNTTATIEKIETIESELLRNILVVFAWHVFDDSLELEYSERLQAYSHQYKKFPDYDFFYELVNEEIDRLNLPEPALFTWLTPSQKEEATDYLEKHPIPDITKIINPKKINFPKMFSDVYGSMETSSSAQNSISIGDKSKEKSSGKCLVGLRVNHRKARQLTEYENR